MDDREPPVGTENLTSHRDRRGHRCAQWVLGAWLGGCLALGVDSRAGRSAETPGPRPATLLSVLTSHRPTAGEPGGPDNPTLARIEAAVGGRGAIEVTPHPAARWGEDPIYERILRVRFREPWSARSAIPDLERVAGVLLVQPLDEPRLGVMETETSRDEIVGRAGTQSFSIDPGVDPSADRRSGESDETLPDDPYCHAWPWGYPQDAQWGLFNHGARGSLERCGPALPGADVRVRALWERRSRAKSLVEETGSIPWIGSPEVAIGFLDVGLRDAHEDLSVVAHLTGQAPFTVCPNADWCGDHATKMGGLAAARGDNGIGVAGVCPDCSLVDFTLPACACATCDQDAENCLFVTGNWPTHLLESLELPLGTAANGRDRRMTVVCAPFASAGHAPIEQFVAIQAARRAGVLVVAATGDQSLSAPSPRYPANVPGVLGAGGSTWEDRFWDARVSCYPGQNGTTIGPGVVDLCAPASGKTVTTFQRENPNGAGLYANTTGQCSAAAAQIAGAAGVLQAEALHWSGHRDWLEPDDLAGVLTATARPFSVDPTFDPSCPPAQCPRAMYGAGILDVERAAYLARHAGEWRELRVDATSGWTVERVGSALTWDGSTWWEYRVSAEVEIPRRVDDPSAPAGLPWYLAWARGARSGAPAAYGSGAVRVAYAQTGATDCQVEVDPASGIARVTGSNFARVVGGGEEPLVAWDAYNLRVAYWAGPHRPDGRGEDVIGEPGATALSRSIASRWMLTAAPNPSGGEVSITWAARGTRESGGGAARLELFDAAGRLVRRLTPGYPSARAGRTHWDGTDARGARVPTGLYWLRLSIDGETTTRALVRAPGAE